MASKCKTALVEPPRAITTMIAFSKAARVRMSPGQMLSSIKRKTASPASTQSRTLSSETASCAELFGKLIPRASMAEAIVLAVYIPPQDPAPGMAQDSTSSSSFCVIEPAASFPTASKIETISTS